MVKHGLLAADLQRAPTKCHHPPHPPTNHPRTTPQLRVMKEVAFAHKQRAIRQALQMGEQIARRRARAALAASFTAWRVQVTKYRRVADKLASMLELSLRSAFAAWRGAAGAARVRRLQAERHAARTIRARMLAVWRSAAEEERERMGDAAARAEALWFASCGAAALSAWREAAARGNARRTALARVILLVHESQRLNAMSEALDGWRNAAARRRGIRTALVSFVNRRRLAVLSEYLTYWRQYAAAMRADGGGAWMDPSLPLVAPRSAHQDRRLIRRMALLKGSIEVGLAVAVVAVA